MDLATRHLIERIHQAPAKCVLALTGGGTSAAAQLLAVPGGSRTVVEVMVPYAAEALVEFLGHRPEQFCSAETALAMARRANERGRWLAPGEPVVGIGGTASLATDRPKRGEHRFHIASHVGVRGTCHSLTLTKGARDREGEETVLSAALLNLLAEAVGVADRLPLPLLPGEALQVESASERDDLSRFLRGELPTVGVMPDGRASARAPRPAVLLPGAFNPIHAGHCQLLETAARLAGGPAAFELSVTNVDKPPLSPEDVRRRLGQLAWLAPAWLTRAPRFVEKAELFPGVRFIVGADTAARLVEPRYYENSEQRMAEALDRIRALGCRFLVAGRADADGRFVELEHLAIPEAWSGLFTAIPQGQFRVDLSSTHLRGEQAGRGR